MAFSFMQDLHLTVQPLSSFGGAGVPQKSSKEELQVAAGLLEDFEDLPSLERAMELWNIGDLKDFDVLYCEVCYAVMCGFWLAL
jgi:hypothetical protein